MPTLDEVVTAVEAERYLKINEKIRELYEAMSGQEARRFETLDYAELLLQTLPEYITLLQEPVELLPYPEDKGYFLARSEE